MVGNRVAAAGLRGALDARWRARSRAHADAAHQASTVRHSGSSIFAPLSIAITATATLPRYRRRSRALHPGRRQLTCRQGGPCVFLHTSVSIGLSELNKGEMDIQTLIERADKALYEAKNGGRNRCVSQTSQPEDVTRAVAWLCRLGLWRAARTPASKSKARRSDKRPKLGTPWPRSSGRWRCSTPTASSVRLPVAATPVTKRKPRAS